MERRQFLIRSLRGGSVLLILPVGWSVAGCGNGGTYGTTPITAGNSLLFTSSNVNGHAHDFSIEMSVVSQPPAAGLSADTTTSGGHMHSVSLSQAELNQIAAGQTVSKDTSVTLSHMHTFQFAVAATTSTATGGTTGAAGKTGTTGTAGTFGKGPYGY